MARDEGGELLRIVNQICRELGPGANEEWLSAAAPATFDGGSYRWARADLSRRHEEYVQAMRQALAGVADAAGAASLTGERQQIIQVALDGVELITRTKLAMGNPGELRRLLPSFVFLVVLPVVQQDEALALSERVAELVEQGLRA